MAVRMSNNMIAYNYLTSLNNASYKLNKQLEQLASESKLNRPSDSPIDCVLDLRYRVSLAENEQYTKNLNLAKSWMETTYDCMSEIESKILQRARELTVQAANGATQTGMTYEAIAQEIDSLIGHLVQVANTTIGDRYIFAGQNDRGEAPFYLNGTGTTDVVNYTGDNNKISMVINPGAANPALDGVNLTGLEVFGPFVDETTGEPIGIFADLINLRDTLKTGKAPDGSDAEIWLTETALGILDADIDKILSTQTKLSARVSMYNMVEDMLSASNVRINADISLVEDVDVPSVATAFTIAQSAYNAALSMGAKILPMSLLDFLR